MKAVETAPHEYMANYVYSGLGAWFGAARLVDATGSRRGSFTLDGEKWRVTLSYQESGLAPPDGGETPDGTRVDFDTLREFRLNAVADDEVGERKVKALIQPRWRGLESTEGKSVARPMWDLGDAVNVRVNASNVEFDRVESVIQRAAGAVTLDPMYFESRNDEYSVVIDAARYVRLDRDVCGAIHSREGPLARMGHLLESDRSGYRKLVQDDTERAGYYHTVTLGPKRIREAFPDHRIPKEFKHYYARNAESLPDEHPLAHPKLEASYQSSRWDETLRPVDHDEIADELEEAILATLNESGLPTQPLDDDGPGGGRTFVEDAYFEAETVDRSRVLPLNLERVESDQRNVVVRQLADGLSPVEWDSLKTLVADGGDVSPAEIADEHDWHPDSVRRGLRRIEEMVVREQGSVALRSHHVAEQVLEALDAAREGVRKAMGTAANAVQNAERASLDERTDELIAFCQANGIHIDEREAHLRVRMGNLADESWSELVTRLKRYWVGAGRDPERLKEAVSHYRDASDPKIRPVRSAWGKGQTLR
ncbi:hypothetical protein DVK05_14455 [Halorubrum sp. Atlit-8R]|uniref:DUF7845 domain-containing protein n=1 Tax=unclassified Halorubrum TaxID=2642239 RepID=UPI000EF20966|nr:MULTISPECIES: hypothetical protein [unclassified Halorubrum]RLM63477.1 hypothetical protein DVK08_16200 [Halorubrum sp. Atlit-9R]RLM76953.1 hypothetical protein DVK05_14455 [Halorubrum sp. Atlit-8R]